MLDKFKRNINYLRVSVTDRCDLRCIYCMPETGIIQKSHRQILSYEKILKIIREACHLGIDKVRFTGGEPLVRKNILFLVRETKKIAGIRELTMTTNGRLLSGLAAPLKQAGLDRINISLDTLSAEKYRTITRIGDIKDVLAGIDAAIAAGFQDTKINMVVLPDLNDHEVGEMQAFCRSKGIRLQRINHYSLTNLNSINQNYAAERPLPCVECNRLRLTADGKLKPCLFSDLEIPVDFNNIKESLKQAIIAKPEEGKACNVRQNWQIGG